MKNQELTGLVATCDSVSKALEVSERYKHPTIRSIGDFCYVHAFRTSEERISFLDKRMEVTKKRDVEIVEEVMKNVTDRTLLRDSGNDEVQDGL